MEEEILPTVRDLGIGFVAYSPLGRGFLSGRFQSPDDFEEGDFRANNPRFQGGNFEKNLELVERVKRSLTKKTPQRVSSRSHGSWLRVTTSCRFPAPSGSPI